MTFNELLKEVGDFGLYQKCLNFGFLFWSIAVMAISYWCQVFILLVAPHRCRLHENDTWEGNATLDGGVTSERCHLRVMNSSSPTGEDWTSTSSKTTGSDDTNFSSMPCPNGWVYDFSLFLPTMSTENNWVCHDSWKMYVIHTWYWMGAVVGYVIFGIFCDRYGRKRCFQASVLLLLVSDIATFCVKSHIGFTIARFFSAMGQGNLSATAFFLAMEYTGPKHRTVVVFMWGVTWTITSFLMPAVPYFVRKWNFVLLTSVISSTIALVISYFIPESACWLLTRGRLDEAAKLMQRVGEVNGRKVHFDAIKNKLQTEVNGQIDSKCDITSNMSGKSEGSKDSPKLSSLQTVFSLFKTPNMRKKSIFLIIIGTISCLCYNGNSIQVSNLPFNLYLSFAIGAIVELPENIFCILFLDKFGRRWMNFGFLLIAGIMGLACGCLKQGGHIVLVLAMIMRTGLAASYDISFTFSSESFPTEARGRSMSIVKTFGGVGSALGPFVVSLSEYDRLMPLIVFGVLCMVAAVLSLFVPETAGQELPHTLEDGENFGKGQSFFFCPFKHEEERNGADEFSGNRSAENPCQEKENVAMENNESA